MNRIFLLGLMLASSAALAATPTYSIKQLQLSRQRVVVSSNEALEPGTELIATFKDGSQCTVNLTAVRGHIANADVSHCASASSMYAGQTLERSLLVEESTAPKAVASPMAKWTPRPPPPRQIYDLQYMPRVGQLALRGMYQFANTKATAKYSSGDKIVDVTTTTHELSLEGLYGYTERFAFGLRASYLLGQTDESSFGPGMGAALDGTTQKAKSDGLRDPSLSLLYRLTEEDTVPVITDLRLDYSPNTGKNRSATVKNKGTAYRGGDLLRASIEVGHKAAEYSFSGQLSADFYGISNAADAQTGVGNRYSAKSVYTLGISGQMPVSEFYLRGVLARVMEGEQSSNKPGTEIRSDSFAFTVLKVGVLKTLTADDLLVELDVAKQVSSDSSAQISGTPADTSVEGFLITAGLIKTF